MFILGKFTSIHMIRQQSSKQFSEQFSEQSEIVCANRTNTKVNCCFWCYAQKEWCSKASCISM